MTHTHTSHAHLTGKHPVYCMASLHMETNVSGNVYQPSPVLTCTYTAHTHTHVQPAPHLLHSTLAKHMQDSSECSKLAHHGDTSGRLASHSHTHTYMLTQNSHTHIHTYIHLHNRLFTPTPTPLFPPSTHTPRHNTTHCKFASYPNV